MENTGYKRSLTISVSRYINGVIVTGYPKVYDGRDAFIAPVQYASFPSLTDLQFALLTSDAYQIRLEAFKEYIEGQESGLDFSSFTMSTASTIRDIATCP